jgi:hypothetical protein
MGLETALDTVDRLNDEGQTTAARALRAWVNLDPEAVAALLRQLPGTRGGQSRALRLSMCGVAFLARRGALVGFARRGCKDRLCPTCSARRSRRFAAALREYIAAHPWARRRLRYLHTWASAARRLFVTLTQPKRAGETARQAMDRLLAAWRRFIERYGRVLLAGGVRSMEVTARRAGQRVGDYTVESAGVHAHLHCVLDTVAGWVAAPMLRRPTSVGHRRGAPRRAERPGLKMPKGRGGGNVGRRGDLADRPRVSVLQAAWCASSPGAAEVGVDVQAVDESNIYQVASYAVDYSGLVDLIDGAPGYVRAVLAAMHGRRTVAAFGTWKGAELGLRESAGTLDYGDRAVYTLATGGPDAAPVHWSSGEVQEADAVLSALLDGPRAPLG